MQYGRIQQELRQQLIDTGKIENLGRSYKEGYGYKFTPALQTLRSFVDKLKSEFIIDIKYNTKCKTLYSSSIYLRSKNNEN